MICSVNIFHICCVNPNNGDDSNDTSEFLTESVNGEHLFHVSKLKYYLQKVFS